MNYFEEDRCTSMDTKYRKTTGWWICKKHWGICYGKLKFDDTKK